jgi:hypothetical protein
LSAARRSGARRPGERLKGRWWLAIWLASFLAVALVVVWRQGAAVSTAREVAELERRRGSLEVRRAMLTGSIQRGGSRGVLVPLAERRLGLRLPQDSEITILQEPLPR